MTSHKGKRDRVQKMMISGDFQGITKSLKKVENWGDVIFGWSLKCKINWLIYVEEQISESKSTYIILSVLPKIITICV